MDPTRPLIYVGDVPDFVPAGIPAALSFARRAVYVEPADAVVVADVHLGRDLASSVELPLGERADLTDRLSAVLDRFEPATLVVAGDLLHAFSAVPSTVERRLAAVRDAVEDRGAALIVTPGNHDSVLSAVYDGSTVRTHRLDDGETVVCHGHEPPDHDAAARRYVVGHDHPAIRIEGRRHPCFLYGEAAYDGAAVLVVPAFNRLARGVVVNRMTDRDFSSPLVSGSSTFRPIVYDDDAGRALGFPPLGKLRPYL